MHATHVYRPRNPRVNTTDFTTIQKHFARRCAKFCLRFAGSDTPLPVKYDPARNKYIYTPYEFPESFTSSTFGGIVPITLRYTPPSSTHDRHTWTAYVKNALGEDYPLAVVSVKNNILHTPFGKKIIHDKKTLQRALSVSAESNTSIDITERLSPEALAVQPMHPCTRPYVFLGHDLKTRRTEIIGYLS